MSDRTRTNRKSFSVAKQGIKVLEKNFIGSQINLGLLIADQSIIN
jgi:hypothetical protein